MSALNPCKETLPRLSVPLQLLQTLLVLFLQIRYKHLRSIALMVGIFRLLREMPRALDVALLQRKGPAAELARNASRQRFQIPPLNGHRSWEGLRAFLIESTRGTDRIPLLIYKGAHGEEGNTYDGAISVDTA